MELKQCVMAAFRLETYVEKSIVAGDYFQVNVKNVKTQMAYTLIHFKGADNKRTTAVPYTPIYLGILTLKLKFKAQSK